MKLAEIRHPEPKAPATKKPAKTGPRKSPSDLGQKARTFRNKQAQRARHTKRNPNDKSVLLAKRWTKPV